MIFFNIWGYLSFSLIILFWLLIVRFQARQLFTFYYSFIFYTFYTNSLMLLSFPILQFSYAFYPFEIQF